MKSRKLMLSIVGLTLLGISIGLSASYLITPQAENIVDNSATQPSTPDRASEQGISSFAMSYAFVSMDNMIKYSEVILVGQVTHVSETKWNQDSGAFWIDTVKDDIGETTLFAFPYIEVTIVPAQILLDLLDIKEPMVVTVLGGESNLKIGDEIIAFVIHHEIAWYYGEVTYNKSTNSFESGRKPVIGFIAAPNQSYLLKNPDGLYHFVENYEQLGPFSLEEVIDLVQEKRATP